MDLSTSYLGLKLKNPLMVSAGPMSESMDKLKRCEDNGVSGVVMHSLFEEQITRETYDLNHHLEEGTESYAESSTYFPELQDFVVGPEEYLENIRKAKAAVKIPIIASLNGHSLGGWTKYARHMQDAGADALELNVYFIPTNKAMTGVEVEQKYIDILKNVKSHVTIPVSVKLNPFFSAMANMAQRLDEAGANGLALFNRFYQPDIDLETLEVNPNVMLSTPWAMRLPLRWIAILYGRIKADMAATSGVHRAEDIIKLLMVGANATMVCSALLKNGIPHAKTLLDGVQAWMAEHEYESVKQMQGSMSQKSVENPEAFERANYMKALTSGAAKIKI